MKLTASLIVKDELSRYLVPCIDSLLEFVDEIRVLNDGSTDGSDKWLVERDDRIQVSDLRNGSFFQHEGRARQVLLDWTLQGEPSHILALDSDEAVSDGSILRAACEADEGPGAWAVGISEVWKVDQRRLWLRVDGAWGLQSRSPLLYRAPTRVTGKWRIMDRALACGREPMAVRALRATPVNATVYHFGWTDESARAARYQRYVEHDGGRFHNQRHLDSIMYEDRRVKLRPQVWPPALEPWKQAILGS